MHRPVQWNYAARAASRRKSIPARFEKADPCSGIMPLARRTGEDKPSLLDCTRPHKEYSQRESAAKAARK